MTTATSETTVRMAVPVVLCRVQGMVCARLWEGTLGVFAHLAGWGLGVPSVLACRKVISDS